MAASLKLALRVLARRKFFTFASLVGIVLTLVVLMIAVATLDNVFVARAPETKLDRSLLVTRTIQRGEHSTQSAAAGWRLLDRTVRDLPGSEAVTIFSESHGASVRAEGEPVESHLRYVDDAYWKVLDFRFLEGGAIAPDDSAAGRPVAVIARKLSHRLFGGASPLGRAIEVSGQRFRVVGVVDDVPSARQMAFSEIYVPLLAQKGDAWKESACGDFNAIVVAGGAADFRRIRSEFALRLRKVPTDDPSRFREIEAHLDTPFESFARGAIGGDGSGKAETAIVTLVMLVAAGLFVTLPILNLVTLSLSRILERAPEIGVRKAFGAPSRALVRQLVFENVVLTVIGGLLAFGLSIAVLAAIEASNLLPNARLEVNFRVFLGGLLVSVLFGILSGALPALRMSRLDPVEALRGGAR